MTKNRYKYVCFRNAYHASGGGELNNLKFLIEHGNVTTYQWIHGEAPLRIIETNFDFGKDEEEEIDERSNAEIDFDCIDVSPQCEDKLLDGVELDIPAEIDWGDLEMVDNAGGNVDIDWDNIDVLNQMETYGIKYGVWNLVVKTFRDHV